MSGDCQFLTMFYVYMNRLNQQQNQLHFVQFNRFCFGSACVKKEKGPTERNECDEVHRQWQAKYRLISLNNFKKHPNIHKQNNFKRL